MRRLRTARVESTSCFWSLNGMRDELSHALVEALYELELLPMNDDAALIGMYAVMDDLENAIERTKSLDPSQHNLLVLPEPRPLPGCGRPHRARA